MSEASIFILAVEPSADKLGADLSAALKQENPKVSINGIGGSAMAAVGVESDFDISDLAIMGYVEVLKSYSVIRRKIKTAVKMIMDTAPDAVVLIDSWGFMIRVAAGLKKNGYAGKIIKYVAPQVWAMRPGRAKTLARYVDHLLSIQTMDEPYFREVGLAQTFVGNPMFDEDFSPDHGADFRVTYRLGERPIIAVLFGSRRGEIDALFRPFLDAIEDLKTKHKSAVFMTVIPPNLSPILSGLMEKDPRTETIQIVDEADKRALFASADVALACSGTVTTQLAMCGVPSIVAYKLNALTYGVGKYVFQPHHISLVNISADEPIIPEFLQGDVTGENLSNAASQFLEDANLRAQTSDKLLAQVAIMKGKGGPASKRAALAILEVLDDA